MAKRKTPTPVHKPDNAGLEWTPLEIEYALNPTYTTENVMAMTGRTRSSVNKKRWELGRMQKHHPLSAPCHCICFRLNGWHCEGGNEHRKFVREHKDPRQPTLFNI